jgi:hypothetical protein
VTSRELPVPVVFDATYPSAVYMYAVVRFWYLLELDVPDGLHRVS